MSEKGYIKFQCNWIKSEPLDHEIIKELIFWRDKMYHKSWIGVYSNGIGYGNLSIRLKGNTFVITGTSTGSIKNLSNKHFVKVTAYKLEENTLTCIGPVKASSESLTHAVIYEINPLANAVIHIHDKLLWEKLKNVKPTTYSDVEYGTPGMANEIIRLFKDTNLLNEKIIVMGGHEEGLLSFGSNLEEAGEMFLKYIIEER
jgi:hypothetical protein